MLYSQVWTSESIDESPTYYNRSPPYSLRQIMIWGEWLETCNTVTTLFSEVINLLLYLDFVEFSFGSFVF